MIWKVVALILALQSYAFAQDQFTKQQAQEYLEKSYKGGTSSHCLFTVGVNEFPITEASESKQAEIKSIGVLKDLGIVSVTNFPSMLGIAKFEVKITELLNPKEYFILGNKMFCWNGAEYISSQLVDVENVKGGTAIKWSGAVVYVRTEVRYRDLFQKFHSIRFGGVLPTKERRRLLFRRDVFNGSWRLLATDVAPIDQEFKSDWVPKYLQRD